MPGSGGWKASGAYKFTVFFGFKKAKNGLKLVENATTNKDVNHTPMHICKYTLANETARPHREFRCSMSFSSVSLAWVSMAPRIQIFPYERMQPRGMLPNQHMGCSICVYLSRKVKKKCHANQAASNELPHQYMF